VHVIESGPAAGVIATRRWPGASARRHRLRHGGTTAKGRSSKAATSSARAVRDRRDHVAGSRSRAVATCACRHRHAEVGAAAAVVSVDGAGALHVGPRARGQCRGRCATASGARR
jgi:hypothetical protein